MVKMSYKVRVTLRAEGDYAGHGFGRGIELLLTGIDKHGSLNRAAKELGMAYSKAWRILQQAEEEFKLRLINREGAHGSSLTAEGREFLEHYQEMLIAATEAAEQVFTRHFIRC